MNNSPSFLTLVVASLCACCLAASADEDPEPDTWRVLETGEYSNIQEATHEIINSEADWQEWWQRHNTVREFVDGQERIPAPPEVDFSKETVLIATLGMRSTGGYAVEFADVKTEGEMVVAKLKTKSPGPDDMVTMALTAPYAIIAIPKHEGPVKFCDS